MEKFVKLSGVAAPMPMVNMDTDRIVPGPFLKTIERAGLGKVIFYNMRYNEDGSEIPDFVLNKPAYRDAKILITGDNFGCGSSREHAPWGIADFGIRCIIGPAFADIFFNNCFKNSILPIVLPQETVDLLMADAKNGANATLDVDLEAQTITRPNGDEISFEVEELRKYCLVNGLDDIGLTLQKEKKIAAFEKARDLDRSWMPTTSG
jgi:3-isopropylmalate/(R)-2-methylmalate dehydratase small subunit